MSDERTRMRDSRLLVSRRIFDGMRRMDRQRVLRGIGIACLWVVVGTVLTLELYFNARAGWPMEYMDLVDTAIPQFGRAIMWALLVPFILELRRRVPLTAGHWFGGIGYHLMMSFVVMAVWYLGRVYSYLWFESDSLGRIW